MATPPAPAQSTATAAMREFLSWVARQPRTYAEAMDAWASHCPRFMLWEDALAAGLIDVDGRRGGPIDQASVTLTSRGQAALSD